MPPPSRRSLFVACLGGLLLVATVLPGFAAPDTPPLELRVVGASGGAEVRADPAEGWSSLDTGVALQPGDRVRTDAAETVTLAAPGVSVVELAPGGELAVNRLERSGRPAPPGVSYERILRDEFGLASPRGTVRVYLHPHEDVESRLRLETVNAVAGVRGTTFECSSAGGTACSVLSGSLILGPASLPEPDDWYPSPDDWQGDGEPVRLGEGRQSRLEPGQNTPAPPETLDPEVRRRLQRFRERARSRLLGLALRRLGDGVVVPGTLGLDVQEVPRTQGNNPLDPDDKSFEAGKGLGY